VRACILGNYKMKLLPKKIKMVVFYHYSLEKSPIRKIDYKNKCVLQEEITKLEKYIRNVCFRELSDETVQGILVNTLMSRYLLEEDRYLEDWYHFKNLIIYPALSEACKKKKSEDLYLFIEGEQQSLADTGNILHYDSLKIAQY
jgi:hypothetical protein